MEANVDVDVDVENDVGSWCVVVYNGDVVVVAVVGVLDMYVVMGEREENCIVCLWVVLLGWGRVDPESFLEYLNLDFG